VLSDWPGVSGERKTSHLTRPGGRVRRSDYGLPSGWEVDRLLTPLTRPAQLCPAQALFHAGQPGPEISSGTIRLGWSYSVLNEPYARMKDSNLPLVLRPSAGYFPCVT